MTKRPTSTKILNNRKLIIGALLVAVALFLGIRSMTGSPAAHSQLTQTIQQPTQAQQISAWHDKYGSVTTTIANDAAKIGADVTNQDTAGMLADCQQFEDDLTAALNNPAIPDATAAAHFSSALTYYQQSAQECVAGSQDAIKGEANEDAALINQAASEIETSTSEMQAGTAQTQLTAQAINAMVGD